MAQDLSDKDVGVMNRRRFVQSAGLAAAGMAAAGMLTNMPGMKAFATPARGATIPAGDIAVLKFLAAAELIEDDLWQQYCELAMDNPGFHDALSAIDPALPRQICDDRDNERSHALFINGFLESIGEDPVNLDPFRTLPSTRAQGAQQTGRLTNLSRLTIDTSWYNRYRSAGNPDCGDQFPQIVDITRRPAIPLSRSLTGAQLQLIAHTAAFHFATIEQGGGSLYANLGLKVQSPEARVILGAIGPVEIYQFSGFHKSLTGIFGVSGKGLTFPDLRSNTELSRAFFPEPCRFLECDGSLPLCSVIRPMSTELAGAVATATALVQSGLFTGQSQAFLNAAVALAQAADAM